MLIALVNALPQFNGKTLSSYKIVDACCDDELVLKGGTWTWIQVVLDEGACTS